MRYRTRGAYVFGNEQLDPRQHKSLVFAFLGRPGSGLTAYDSSGFNNHGVFSTVSGGSGRPTWTLGPNGMMGVTTDGGDTFVDLGTPASMEVYNSLTVAFWMKTTQTGSVSFVIAKDDETGDRGFGLGISSSDKLYLEWGGAAVFTNSGPVLNDNRWHHVAATLPGTANESEVYVDGERINGTGLTNLTPNAGAPWYLGGRSYNGFFNGYAGSFCDVRVYNRAFKMDDVFTSSEIREIARL